MKIKVTEQGALIPKDFLVGVKEVEVRRENNLLIISPTIEEEDPTWDLGEDPIYFEVADDSENYGAYLYPRNS
jgi:virulence-associated protein VagC